MDRPPKPQNFFSAYRFKQIPAKGKTVMEEHCHASEATAVSTIELSYFGVLLGGVDPTGGAMLRFPI
ncbi:MAG TPA: hypothetical protein VED66_02010 [Candidatus Sulfotelmatobacter sp.]|nr:hypothetical protein [Candidatus Sulfotelmatobacter sp.]